jgi:hypothetical protein
MRAQVPQEGVIGRGIAGECANQQVPEAVLARVASIHS